MSPEQLYQENYTQKTDIWSLGIILYEMCTFKIPNMMREGLDPKLLSHYSNDLKNLCFHML